MQLGNSINNTVHSFEKYNIVDGPCKTKLQINSHDNEALNASIEKYSKRASETGVYLIDFPKTEKGFVGVTNNLYKHITSLIHCLKRRSSTYTNLQKQYIEDNEITLYFIGVGDNSEVIDIRNEFSDILGPKSLNTFKYIHKVRSPNNCYVEPPIIKYKLVAAGKCYLTITEAAKACGISKSSLRYRINHNGCKDYYLL